ncbi:hypothetical protein ABIB66_005865 [Bradyrhizobium sp. F1.13.3]
MTIDRKAAIAAYQGAEDRCRHLRHPLRGLGRGLDRPSAESRDNPEPHLVLAAQGSHTCRSLQAAWNTHGEAGLTFGECERLEDEETAYVRNALLKERMLHWLSELKAEPI